MSDSLLTLLEMIEEVLEEAKRDVVPGTTFEYVPATSADIEDENLTIVTLDDGGRYVKKSIKPSSRGRRATRAGKEGEENTKDKIEKYFNDADLTHKYSVKVSGAYSKNPDVVVINSLSGDETKIEVKTTIGSNVDLGQGGAQFVGPQDNNWKLKSSSDRQLNLAMRDAQFSPINTKLPFEASQITKEQIDSLKNELGIAAQSTRSFNIQSSPVKNFSHRIAGYYKDKGNKYIIIGDKLLGLDSGQSKSSIPNLGDNQIIKDGFGRVLVRFKDHGTYNSYTIVLRTTGTLPEVGLPLSDALPLIFP